MNKRYSKRPTRQIGAILSLNTYDAIERFHQRFGARTIELDTLVFFILKDRSLTPLSYMEEARAIRAYIMNNYTIEQGSFKPREDVFIRNILVRIV